MTTLTDVLGLQPSEVQSQLTVITKETLPTPLLHIAIKPFALMTPNISRSGMAHENRTIPRIHCSEDLAGCFIGYGFERLIYDLQERDINKSKLQLGKDVAIYRGGYYIHEVAFDYCLKPTKKLVPDVEDSRERWLVTYDCNTVKYPADIIGIIIIQSFTSESDVTEKEQTRESVTFLIKANKPIIIRDDLTMKAGYWRFVLHHDYENKNYELTSITEQEFLLRKNKHANLLSYQTPMKGW